MRSFENDRLICFLQISDKISLISRFNFWFVTRKTYSGEKYLVFSNHYFQKFPLHIKYFSKSSELFTFRSSIGPVQYLDPVQVQYQVLSISKTQLQDPLSCVTSLMRSKKFHSPILFLSIILNKTFCPTIF